MNISSVSRTLNSSQGAVPPVDPVAGSAPMVAQPGTVPPVLLGPSDAGQRKQGSQPDSHQIHEAVEKLNRTLSSLETAARFSVNEDFNQIVIQVLNTRTNEVIREIPPQKVLDAMANMLRLVGLLVDGKG
jgi:flagellar protein FlaG